MIQIASLEEDEKFKLKKKLNLFKWHQITTYETVSECGFDDVIENCSVSRKKKSEKAAKIRKSSKNQNFLFFFFKYEWEFPIFLRICCNQMSRHTFLTFFSLNQSKIRWLIRSRI